MDNNTVLRTISLNYPGQLTGDTAVHTLEYPSFILGYAFILKNLANLTALFPSFPEILPYTDGTKIFRGFSTDLGTIFGSLGYIPFSEHAIMGYQMQGELFPYLNWSSAFARGSRLLFTRPAPYTDLDISTLFILENRNFHQKIK